MEDIIENITPQSLVAAVTQIHKDEYEEEPAVITKAPGHFHLVGEHAWFFKDKTLSMTIDSEVVFALSKRQDIGIRSYFYQTKERKRSALTSLKIKKDDKWSKYIKAIVEGFINYGYEISGLNCTVYSEMKRDEILGFSTAMKISIAMAIREMYDFDCDSVTFFQIIKYANTLLEVLTYEADNLCTLYSEAGSLFVTDYATSLYDPVPFSFEGKSIFVVDLNVPATMVVSEDKLLDIQNALLLGDLKEDKEGVYGGWQYTTNSSEINEQLMSVASDIRRKLLCVMREHKDVLDAMKACQKDDFDSFARAINHSNVSFRDFYDLSSPETNWLLKRVSEFDTAALSEGHFVGCGRVLGKTSPRFVYVVLRDSDEGLLKEKLDEYEHIFSFHPVYYKVKPSSGAEVLKGLA